MLGETPGKHLQARRVELPYKRREADQSSGITQCPHHMAQIALCLTLVVGLRETLSGECLVGNLACATVTERVVDRRSPRGPLEEPAPGGPSGVSKLLTHPAVSLWVNDDGSKSSFDRARGEPRLCDRLTGAGGTNDQSVPTALGNAEGDRHELTADGTSDDHLLVVQDAARQREADTPAEPPRKRTQRYKRPATSTGDLRQVATGK